jgi:hypothetical protein
VSGYEYEPDPNPAKTMVWREIDTGADAYREVDASTGNPLPAPGGNWQPL